ncbi:MAG TPA: class I SAM-dependent methyltransferase [Methanocella sp.]|jgi:tRNA (cmo5U34)-methyltransferase
MKTTDNGQRSANFDSNPPVGVSQYDSSIRQFTAAYEPMFTMAYACLRSLARDDARLLIAGAGTGMEICTFGPHSPGWNMTGVDPSGEMLAIAQKKIDEEQLANPINLFKGYVHDLPETTDYDAATCILVMHFLPDDGSKLRLLESISRRLKSGSPFILVDGFGMKDSDSFNRTVSAWKTFAKTQGADPQLVEEGFSGQILKRLQFVPEERIVTLLEEAGFEKPSRFYTGFLYGGWMTTKK